MVAALKIFQNLLRQVAVVFAASYHGLTKSDKKRIRNSKHTY